MYDDNCFPLEERGGFEGTGNDQQIPAKGVGVWTCTARVNKVTIGTVAAKFGTKPAGKGSVSYSKSATYVGVTRPNHILGSGYGIAKCNVLDFTTVGNTGNVQGTMGSLALRKDPSSSEEVVESPAMANAIPLNNAGFNLSEPNNPAAATTASATWVKHPEWIYYTSRVIGQAPRSGDANIGLYRIDKRTGEVTKIKGPHWNRLQGPQNPFCKHSDVPSTCTHQAGATATNRLGFGPDGTLWSLAIDGKLYSLQLDEMSGMAIGDWIDRGSIPTDVKVKVGSDPSQTESLNLGNFSFGDLAVDSSNTMWIIASKVGVETIIDGVVSSDKSDDSYLFTLSAGRLLSGEGDIARLATKVTIAPGAHHKEKRFLRFGIWPRQYSLCFL